jgi:hypothetical protein
LAPQLLGIFGTKGSLTKGRGTKEMHTGMDKKRKERDVQELVNSHFRNKPYDIKQVQKFKIDKLMEKIDTPLELEQFKEPLQDTKPMGNPHQSGSTAHEFHAYRVDRRKEMHRQELLEQERERAQDQLEFVANLNQLKKNDDAKTAKNRLKRAKKKAKKVGDNG